MVKPELKLGFVDILICCPGEVLTFCILINNKFAAKPQNNYTATPSDRQTYIY